jgi:FkbM family methyltransferase
MTFLSYAQNFEDVMLWRALKHIKNGFYIDIGAAWPSEDSVTKAFYDRGWRGINIEPNPVLITRLNLERPDDVNLQLAVGDKPGVLQMSLISGTGLSTLESIIAEKHAKNGYAIEQTEVEIKTLVSICASQVALNQPIHFLKVDVEGFEEKVLAGHDWGLYRPWIVVVEATLPMSQIQSYESWEHFLLAASYTFAYCDGLNRFYVANEHSELLPAFSYPPNVFDEFIQANQEKTACLLVDQSRALAEAAVHEKSRLQFNVNDLQGRNEQLQLEFDQLRLQHRASVQRLEELDAHMMAMYRSLSWRITSPLRWLKFQVYCLKRDGLRSRLNALFKKLSRTMHHQFSPTTSLPTSFEERGQLDGNLPGRAGQIYKKLRAIYPKL